MEEILSEILNQVKELKGEVLGLKGEVSDLRGEVTGVKSEVSDLRGEVTGVKSEVSDLRSEVTGVKSEVSDLRGEATGLKGEIADLRTEMNERFEQQKKELTKEIMEKVRMEMDVRFAKQSEEIAQELRNIINYFEKKQRKQEKLNREFMKEMKNNKIAQDVYNTRIYKIERVQSDLESRVFNLENKEMIAN